jgi:hypothetical protein
MYHCTCLAFFCFSNPPGIPWSQAIAFTMAVLSLPPERYLASFSFSIPSGLHYLTGKSFLVLTA